MLERPFTIRPARIEDRVWLVFLFAAVAEVRHLIDIGPPLTAE